MWPAFVLAMLLQAAPVTWSISAPDAKRPLKPGSKTAVTVVASIAPGWHLYSLKKLDGGPIPTSIIVPDGQPFRLGGKIDAPAPQTKFDDTFQMDVSWYEDSAAFVVPVQIGKDAKSGAASLSVHARFQVCNDKECLPPRTVKMELPLELK